MDNNIENNNNNIEKNSSPFSSSETSENEDKLEKKKKKLLPIILLLSFLTLACFIYIFLMMRADDPTVDDSEVVKEEETKEITEGPKGEIYLTLSPLEKEFPEFNVYSLDLLTSELKTVFENEAEDNFMASFSPDGSEMVFVRRYPDFLSQILYLNLENDEIVEMTSKSFYFERNPVMTSGGEKVAFWAYSLEEDPYGFGTLPEDHSVYLVSQDLKIEEVANGVFPKFTSDGENLIYMKNDGIYSLNLLEGGESLLLEVEFVDVDNEFMQVEYPNWLSFRFDISDKFLVLSDSLNSVVSLYSIDSFSPLSLEAVYLQEPVPSPVWPLFSPQGDYLAVQGDAVRIFSAETLDLLFEYPLDEYSSEYIWMSDWLSK